jgi:hypothetical protein
LIAISRVGRPNRRCLIVSQLLSHRPARPWTEPTSFNVDFSVRSLKFAIPNDLFPVSRLTSRLMSHSSVAPFSRCSSVRYGLRRNRLARQSPKAPRKRSVRASAPFRFSALGSAVGPWCSSAQHVFEKAAHLVRKRGILRRYDGRRYLAHRAYAWPRHRACRRTSAPAPRLRPSKKAAALHDPRKGQSASHGAAVFHARPSRAVMN